MKGISKIRYSSSQESTMETSIPIIFVKMFHLKAGEQLEWESVGLDITLRKVKWFLVEQQNYICLDRFRNNRKVSSLWRHSRRTAYLRKTDSGWGYFQQVQTNLSFLFVQLYAEPLRESSERNHRYSFKRGNRSIQGRENQASRKTLHRNPKRWLWAWIQFLQVYRSQHPRRVKSKRNYAISLTFVTLKFRNPF